MSRQHVAGAVGVLAAAAMLWWTLHGVDLTSAFRLVQSGRPALLLAAACAAYAGVLARGVRWRFLLPRGSEPATRALVEATLLGTFMNNVAPVRAGEVAAVVALKRRSGLPMAAGLSSSAAGRALDVLVVLTMLSGALLLSLGSSSYLGVSLAITAASGLLMAAIVATAWFPRAFRRHTAAVAHVVLPPRARGRAAHLVDGVLHGTSALRSARRLGLAVGWTVLSWTLNAAAGYLGLQAFHINTTVWAPFVLQGFLAIGVALPSTPGFFGPFEAAGRVALGLYGVSPTAAVGFVIPFHLAVYFVPSVLTGLLILFFRNPALADGSESAAASPSTPKDVRRWHGLHRGRTREIH